MTMLDKIQMERKGNYVMKINTILRITAYIENKHNWWHFMHVGGLK